MKFDTFTVHTAYDYAPVKPHTIFLPMKPLSESALEKKVVAYCRERGLYTRKFSSPAHRGVPDRIICGKNLRGEKDCLFLELKRKGEFPTALQYRELLLLRDAGQRAEWADDLLSAEMHINGVFGYLGHDAYNMTVKQFEQEVEAALKANNWDEQV